MTDTRITLRNGDISAYGFACGYLQCWTIDGTTDYYGTTADGVMLSRPAGCTDVYDVHVRRAGLTFDASGMFPEWIENADGHRARADWHQFETLRDARAAFARFRREIETDHAARATQAPADNSPR